MAEHPGLVFKDGPSGRRPAVASGPDVWELIKLLRELDESGEAAVSAAAELLALSEAKVRVALRYYTAYPKEIDRRIDEVDRFAAEAKHAWEIEPSPVSASGLHRARCRLSACSSHCWSISCFPFGDPVQHLASLIASHPGTVALWRQGAATGFGRYAIPVRSTPGGVPSPRGSRRP